MKTTQRSGLKRVHERFAAILIIVFITTTHSRIYNIRLYRLSHGKSNIKKKNPKIITTILHGVTCERAFLRLFGLFTMFFFLSTRAEKSVRFNRDSLRRRAAAGASEYSYCYLAAARSGKRLIFVRQQLLHAP